MSRSCDCNGCASGPQELPLADVTRREFLRTLGVGALAVYGGSLLQLADAGTWPRPPTPSSGTGIGGGYPVTPPRLYTGEHLGAVAMPIGGIGTGTIWLDGQGRLRVWQIFNNSTEPRVPCSFLAMRVQVDGQEPVLRVLQTEPEPGFPACPSLTFEGGYPLAVLQLDTGLPIAATVEAFNPMIPTDVANSSLPCAVLRVRVRNEGDRSADVALLATLQNAVGYEGSGEITGTSHWAFGGNENRLVSETGLTAIAMGMPSEPPPTGFLRARHKDGHLLGTDPLLWLGQLEGPTELAAAGVIAYGGLDALSRLSGRRAVVVSSGASPEFFEALAAARIEPLEARFLEVFEDFEGPTYEGWTVEGEAFGTGPSRGTHPGQQLVSGFLGRGLVNTYLPNDGPQGRLISRPFTIEHNYIGFLIGGGAHTNETCMNLWVNGKVVRTACGKNLERLEPQTWDVREFRGAEGQIEIVDARSDGWGHINVDHIVFSHLPPDSVLQVSGAFARLAKDLPLSYSRVTVVEDGDGQAILAEGVQAPAGEPWIFSSHVRLEGLALEEGQPVVLARAPNGDPVLLQLPLGQATVVLALAPNMPWSWARHLFCHVNGLDAGQVRFETTRSGWGSMALSTGEEARALVAWTDGNDLAARFLTDPHLGWEPAPMPSPEGQTVNGALSVPLRLQPGESREACFVVTWHFPNVERFGHVGNHYCQIFSDALDAARYVVTNLAALTEKTLLYHRTIYESNLPEEFLDAMTSQSVILRGPTCWRSADGYFGGYEGAYECCPLNCTHVWNYAQTHARLFPEIGRNMRISDFITYLHEDGETSHRQHAPCGAFADGHCACIVAALREHQLSRDDRFLRRIYPGVKKAMEWFIRRFDPQEEGLTHGHQWNTYDTAVSGPNTFIGSQYLAALAAAEVMAQAVGDVTAAERWRALRERGAARQEQELWGGEYYIQKPETPPAHDYNNGCHSDQLLGQWWAHQLGLGYLYPPQRVAQACRSIFRYNFKPDFRGLEQTPRRYVDNGDGGLYMCQWPHNDRPDPYTLYSLEVWTGVEYATAGLFVFEGLIEEARQIVATARARYDGRPRQNLNSGGGVCGMGNPFQELECGKFYARAQSSWGLLVASQGLVLDGPAGILGFKPRWRPEDHRSFFTVPEGWGLFVQRRGPNGDQTERIELRHGRAVLSQLIFSVRAEGPVVCQVEVGGKILPARTDRGEDGEVRVLLAQPVTLTDGDVLEVRFSPGR